MRRARLPALVLLTALAAWQAALAETTLDEAFPQSSLVIEASHDACYRFDVHLALDDRQRQRGLMYVRRMPANRGMLFVYDEEAFHSMWMKNTFIPLDMLFIRRDGRIAAIAMDTEPQSLVSIRSDVPVQYVLELNAGVTESLHIVDGDRVIWNGDVDESAMSEN